MADNGDKLHEKFNEDVLQMIVFAKAASINANVDCIYPQSFMIGILTTGANEVASVLVDMDINLENCLKIFKSQLITKQSENSKTPEYQDLKISKQVVEVCKYANEISEEMGMNRISSFHIFLALLHIVKEIKAVFVKEKLDVNEFIKRIKDNYDKSSKSTSGRTNTKNPKKSALESFCNNITDLARNNKLDPILARESEIECAITILCRRTKNNLILVGEPGVGKTAIVEGISQRIVNGTVPKHLMGCELYSLNLTSLVSGTKYRGQFEERMESLIKEIRSTENCILFIDEIHTLIGTGSGSGSLDASNILKPFLARGELRCIGATTIEEYKRYFQKEGALNRRFQQILIEETTKDQTKQILHGIKHKMEEFHACTVSDDAIDAIVNLTARYLPTKRFPDKAIDCLDITCAKKTSWDCKDRTILVDDIAKIIGEQLQIPPEVILWGDNERVKKIKEILDSKVIGQPHAIETVCRTLKNSYSGVRNPDKPIGSFIFGGETGTGKTYMAKELAEALFQKTSSLVRVDLSEFSEQHTVSQLIGSPPGYVGFQEVDVFIDKIKRKPYSVILLDELEKAHPNVIKLFLQVLSDGFMSDASGNQVNFKNTILIMTGNFGMNEEAKNSLGFGEQEQIDVTAKAQKRLIDFCKTRFGEEFVNRIDDFVPFMPLDEISLKKIAVMRLKELAERVSTNRHCKISFTAGVIDDLVKSSKSEHGKNAGSLNRLISKKIEPSLADALISIGNNKSYSVVMDVENEEFVCRKRKIHEKR